MKPIDQYRITKDNRTPTQLLHFLLWTTVVAGKRSDVQTTKFNQLFEEQEPEDLINQHGNAVRGALRSVGMGQETRLTKCWRHIANNIRPTHLRNIDRDILVQVPGIGMKTASFFIAHSQAWPEIAVLDTHILKWLRDQFPKLSIPRITPQQPQEYKDIEALFLGRSCQLNISPTDLDNLIWQTATTK